MPVIFDDGLCLFVMAYYTLEMKWLLNVPYSSHKVVHFTAGHSRMTIKKLAGK